MAKITVKQVKSIIGRPEYQRKVVMALGLGRIGKTREMNDSESVRGMVAKVSHLVEIVEK
ncbi:MAG: 50S ribosomal protein L30 [Alphaproteobacteria bacterium]|jgi:large subunit ribosomal protein L30|nr:50S ribosomal protein L30 [Alphaproteobacteria bacterium]MBR6838430.1 50S ribosomal protein L30 [Alphaproteobacteria bacterium]